MRFREKTIFLFCILVAVLIFPMLSPAEIILPYNMSQKDREVATRIFGLESGMKILSDPYPLGGFSGFEVGVSNEVLSTDGVSRLGSASNQSSEVSYTMLTFGKGLYNNLDVFIQFTPNMQPENVTGYGAQLRWTMTEAEYFPLYFTLIGYSNYMNYKNQLLTYTRGADLLATYNVEDVSVFVGAGPVQSQGRFAGAKTSSADPFQHEAGVTDTGYEESSNVSDTHVVVGVNMRFGRSFLAIETDRYSEVVYSAKLGYRF